MALFLWEHHLSPGVGLGRMSTLGSSARFVPQHRVKVSWGWLQPCKGDGFGRCKAEAAGAGMGGRSGVVYLEFGRDLGVGGSGGCWPPSRRRRFLSGFPSHLGIWKFSLCVFMWERRSTKSLSYTCLCKNAKVRVIFFLSIFFFTEEGVVIVSWMHAYRGLQQYF